MDPEEKALRLYEAYRERRTITPFPVGGDEWKAIFDAFTSRIVRDEGFCGYKIAFTSAQALKKFNLSEPAVGILTCGMIDDSSLPFKYSYVEVEVIAEVEDCGSVENCVKSYYLGFEIPSTRFDAPLQGLTTYQILADDAAAWRVVKGVKIDSPEVGEIEVALNGELKGRARGDYVYGDVKGMINWLTKKVGRFSGLVATGAIFGPMQVKPKDRVKVRFGGGEVELELKG